MANKFYGSANSEANLITDLYGGHNDQAQRITKLYGRGKNILTSLPGTIRSTGSGNVSAYDEPTFLSKLQNYAPETYSIVHTVGKIPSYIFVNVTDGPYYMLYIYFEDRAYWSAGYGMGDSGLASWGITAKPRSEITSRQHDWIDLSPTYTETARLIHQGFGHLDYS